MYGKTDGCCVYNGWMDAWMSGCMDGWLDRWRIYMGGCWIDGYRWVDGWLGRWLMAEWVVVRPVLKLWNL